MEILQDTGKVTSLDIVEVNPILDERNPPRASRWSWRRRCLGRVFCNASLTQQWRQSSALSVVWFTYSDKAELCLHCCNQGLSDKQTQRISACAKHHGIPKLGRTGLKVSELCLGTMTFLWTSDEKTSFDVLSAFRAAGGNFIDTADVYSSWAPGNPGGTAELVMGKWWRNNSIPRDKLIFATKGRAPMGDGPNDQGASRVHLTRALEDSLRRLQTDYVDLYQIHWPDHDTPLDETLRALDDFVKSGKVRYVGASNYAAWYLTKSLWISDVRNLVRFESIQPHYNLMHRAEFERELLPLVKDQQLGVIPYSPLAGGFLTGKYRKGQPVPAGTRGANNDRIKAWAESEMGNAAIDKLEAIGKAHGKSVPQTALAWMLSNPIITSPIVGANTVEQLQDSLGAVGYRLAQVEVDELNAITAWTK